MRLHQNTRSTSASHRAPQPKQRRQPAPLHLGTCPRRDHPSTTSMTRASRPYSNPASEGLTPSIPGPCLSRRLLLTLSLALTTAPAQPAAASSDSASPSNSSTASPTPTPSVSQTSTPAPTSTPPPQPPTTAPLDDNPTLDSHWWEHGADRWVEISTPADLQRFLLAPPTADAPPHPAAPPRLRAIEFYAKWCPVCAAKSPELLRAISDNSLAARCAFARVDVEAMREQVSELGIRHVPTMFLYSPDGYKLIDFIASEAALREAVASLAPVFHDQGAIPKAYQADLANLPQTGSDEGFSLDDEWYEGEGGQEGAGGPLGPGVGVTLADGGVGEAVKLSV